LLFLISLNRWTWRDVTFSYYFHMNVSFEIKIHTKGETYWSTEELLKKLEW
jgi:hypothetical protein